MNKQLLLELNLYIKKTRTEDILIRESGEKYGEAIPAKSDKKVLKREAKELDNYINNEKSEETFAVKLMHHIDKKGVADAEIYKKAGLDRRHFSKIRCDKYYRPKKTTVIALCIALELNLNETEKMLQLAGYSFSNSDISDLVVKFFIERKIYDLTAVNEALDYYGQKLLGVVG